MPMTERVLRVQVTFPGVHLTNSNNQNTISTCTCKLFSLTIHQKAFFVCSGLALIWIQFTMDKTDTWVPNDLRELDHKWQQPHVQHQMIKAELDKCQTPVSTRKDHPPMTDKHPRNLKDREPPYWDSILGRHKRKNELLFTYIEESRENH